MRLLLTLAIFIQSATLFGQKRKVYSHDFDYKNLAPKDTLTVSSILPNYYIQTTYLNDALSDIDIFQKEEWMKEPIQIHARIEKINDTTFFIYDSGKTRTGGYGKLFPKNVKFTDTAMLKNDTLIFKETFPNSIHIDYATSIFSDSFYVAQKIFPINKKSKTSIALFSFRNYATWNNLPDYSRFYQILITPKCERVVQAERLIEDGTIDYSYSYLHTRDYFQTKGIPISFLWIKHTGIIY